MRLFLPQGQRQQRGRFVETGKLFRANHAPRRQVGFELFPVARVQPPKDIRNAEIKLLVPLFRFCHDSSSPPAACRSFWSPLRVFVFTVPSGIFSIVAISDWL